tara:strand:+ start:7629 stop:8903 length:1275 start_codon:yes stop_codon:yes gene_type:complete
MTNTLKDNTRSKLIRFTWALYDWANSAWSAIIITFIFSRYFVDILAPDPNVGTFIWTWTIGLSSFLAALLSPVVGSISDSSNNAKTWLIVTTSLYALIAIGLWFAIPNNLTLIVLASIIFVGNVAYEISQIIYNGQLKAITKPAYYAKLSGLAWALGYAGTVIIFGIYYALFFVPEEPFINLNTNTFEHIRISFLLTGFWILIFSAPLFLCMPKALPTTKNITFNKAFINLVETFKEINKYKNLVIFLLARLFYTDGINAIFAVAAIYATLVFQMDTNQIILLALGTNIAAGLGSGILCFVEHRLGSWNMIVISLVAITLISIIILIITEPIIFILLAMCLSLFFGPIQSASRVYFAKAIPENKKYEFFGFYSFSGKVSAFIGPTLFGTVTFALTSPKAGMASVLVLFVIGFFIMLKVKPDSKT